MIDAWVDNSNYRWEWILNRQSSGARAYARDGHSGWGLAEFWTIN